MKIVHTRKIDGLTMCVPEMFNVNDAVNAKL